MPTMSNNHQKRRTTLALSEKQHYLLSCMSNEVELEMSRIQQWGISTLMDIATVRNKLIKENPDLHVRLDSLISPKSTFFLDTMSEQIELQEKV